MGRTRLTKRAVDAAGPGWLWDSDLPGFGLRVHPTGRKVYVLEYRPGSGGRAAPKRRVTVGAHGALTVDQARAEARRLLASVAEGGDPARDRKQDRTTRPATVADLAAAYVDRYCRPRLRSWREADRVLRAHILPALGAMRVADVRRCDVQAIVDKLAITSGPRAATVALAYVRAMWNWGTRSGLAEASPAAHIDPPRTNGARDRVLTDSELARVIAAADSLGQPWGAFVRLLALTGQRRNEVAGMRWSEVEETPDGLLWRLPPGRTKNGRAHTVPLSAEAAAVVRAMPRRCDYVFTTNGRAPISGFSKLKARLAAALSADGPLPDWRLHDLRRTATSGMARLGVRAEVADRVLNHAAGTVQGVAAVYQRHSYEAEARAALAAWGQHVAGLLGEGVPADNVVPLRGAG